MFETSLRRTKNTDFLNVDFVMSQNTVVFQKYDIDVEKQK